MAKKNKKEPGWRAYICKEWVPFLQFLLKPFLLISLIYFVLFMFFSKSEFYKTYNFLLAFISLILGLLIKQEWDKYKGRTDYKNKAIPAIGILDGLESNINRRIHSYESKRPSKEEIKNFLMDIITRINDTRLSWKTFDPEGVTLAYKQYKDESDILKEDELKSKQILEKCEVR